MVKKSFLFDDSCSVILREIEVNNFDNKNVIGFPHMHEFWEIGYIISGSGFYNSKDSVTAINTDDVIISPPFKIHHETSSDRENLKIVYLMFKKTISLNEYFGFKFSKPTILHTKASPEISRIILDLLNESITQAEQYEKMINNYLSSLFILLYRISDDNLKIAKMHQFSNFNDRKLYFVSEIITYLNNRVYEKITMKDVSVYFNISFQHLSRIFKEVTGYSPLQYIHMLRLIEATKLLKNTDENTNIIAESLHFYNIKYFNRLFKEETSFTPLQYRIGNRVKYPCNQAL